MTLLQRCDMFISGRWFHTCQKAVWSRCRTIYVLFVVMVALSACSFWPWESGVDLTPYRIAMLPHAQNQVDQMGSVPRYDIYIHVDTETLTITGHETVSYTNNQSDALDELYFRLYPNLSVYDGEMQVNHIEVEGKEVGASYEATRTALRVPLPHVLRPRQRVQLKLDFKLRAKHQDTDQVLMGQRDDILSLPNFYPILAICQNGSWDLSIGPDFADAVFSDIALYRVDIDVPKGMVVVATGALAGQEDTPEGRRLWHFVSGPARDFGLIMSPLFEKQTMTARNVIINSYHLPADASAGYSALWRAAAALEAYSDAFCEYPYTKLDVAEAPLGKHGMEYPALVLVGTEVYRTERKRLEALVAHEVAHQWWYNLVGSDPVNTPAVDESLAEYSLYYYYERIYGKRYAEQMVRTRWIEPSDYVREKGLDAPVESPAHVFTRDNYEAIVYAKGSRLYSELRQYIGEEAFNTAIRNYLGSYQYRIAPAGAFLGIASGTTPHNLEAHAAKWREPLPTPPAE